MGNDMNNVSARLTDADYKKLEHLQKYMQKNSYSKVSLADAMRVSISNMYDIIVERELAEERGKNLNPSELSREEVVTQLEAIQQGKNTDNEPVEASQTNRNDSKPVNPITEQVNAYKESLKGQIDPDTDKPYTVTKINRLGTAKRKELQEAKTE